MALTSTSFQRGLIKRGFKEIGSGYFSAVYAKPGSDRVIKVSNQPDGWVDYVLWATQQGYAGRFAPRVFSLKVFHGWYVAVMERLECTLAKLNGMPPYRVFSQMAGAIRGMCLDPCELDEAQPGSVAFANDLRTNGSSQNFDLHDQNFMLRKDGTVVCTDPISFSNIQTTSSRLRTRDLMPAQGELALA